MNGTLRKLFLIGILLTSFLRIDLSGQNFELQIDGKPGEFIFCEGSCVQFNVIGLDSNGLYSIVFNIYDCAGQTYSLTNNPATFCFDLPCDYLIQTEITNANNEVITLFDSVTIYPAPFLEIFPSSTNFCEQNGSFGCDQVCEFSTVSYFIETSNPDQVEVTVSGADNYTFNGYEIIVEWGAAGNGYISLFAFDPGGCTSFGDHCIDIIPAAKSKIKVAPVDNNGDISICRGQTVFFESLSENASILNWYFGDGQFSEDQSPEHVYDLPGEYEVSLAAFNNCYCGDTSFVTITVLDAEAPVIDCVGTICENTTVTYTISSNCNEFYWVVSPNGTILDGGGVADNYIEIDWGTGPEGIIFLETANCTGTVCPIPSYFNIPIMSGNASIKGADKVCNGAVENYSIKDYNATYYNWEVPAPGKILSGQGSSAVVVEWYSPVVPAESYIKVDYENCYLDCSGTDQLPIKIRDEFFISGPIEACSGNQSMFRSRKVSNPALPGPLCSWKLYDLSNTEVWSAGSSNNPEVTWPVVSGKYYLEATVIDPDDYCNESYRTFIQVYEPTEAPDGIIGESQICPGEQYTYEADSPHPDFIFNWFITNGADMIVEQGKTVTIDWGFTGPYEISLTQTDYGTFPCESNPVSMVCDPLSLSFLTGNDIFCAYETGSFTTDFFERIEYVWEIIPADAGSVIEGEGSNSVDIQWNAGGNAEIKVSACGSTLTKNIEIKPLPVADVLHPDGVCPGETADVSTAITYLSYSWQDKDGMEVSQDPDPTLPPGVYLVVVTDDFGCEGSEQFYIDEYPLPNVTISTPEDHGFCLPQGESAPNIFALDHDPAFTYQWYIDGSPTGFNKSSLNTSNYGTYYVEVTDYNGCVNTSNIITLFEYCEDSPGGQCNGSSAGLKYCETTAGEINFDFAAGANCNSFTFSNTSTNFLPGSLEYSFGDPAIATTVDEDPAFDFPTAGYQFVLLTGYVADSDNPGVYCEQWRGKTVLVPMAADFDTEEVCVGEPMQFTNRSTYMMGYKYTSVLWDFGDPVNPPLNTSTDLNPTHIYSQPGVFTVTLTIDNGDCTSTIIKQIDVLEQSTLDFIEPEIVCEGKSLEFTANTNLPVTSWTWDFGDPVSGASNVAETQTAYHVFAAPGDYIVSVSIVNIYGCERTESQVITIEDNTLSGTIDYTSPICEGDVSTLTAPDAASYEWSTGETTKSINVTESGIFEVTITDTLGCTSSPEEADITVIPAPVSSIKVVEYNEFGEAVSVYYNNYEACFGTDIHILAEETSGYWYSWSTGESGTSVEYSKERGNLLETGSHEIFLNIIEFATGCTNAVGPMNITIHPLPENIVITASPGGYLCQGDQTILAVSNPEPGINYIWNTGVYGESITTSESGTYFVKGINAFGCETESNEIIVHKAPDIGKIPNGCLERCKPDTMCIPNIPNLAGVQWYFNGTAVSGPEGNVLDFIADQSGEYYVVLEDIYGCTASSEPLNLDLYDGEGDIFSQVYFDVNGNGVIDAGDTLMNNIDVLLIENMNVIQSDNTSNSGEVLFKNITANDYSVTIDTSTLDDAFAVYDNELFAEILTCEDKDTVQFLVYLDCSTMTENVSLELCEGSSIIYAGVTIQNDTSFQILKPINNFCDSVFNIQASLIPVEKTDLNMQVCGGDYFEYEGEKIYAGESGDFVFTSSNGCDSIVSVAVTAFPQVNFDLFSKPSCTDEFTGVIRVINISGSTGPYEYKLNTGNYGANNLFEDLQDKFYEVYVRDANGCVYSEQIDLGTIEPINYYVEDAILDCSSSAVELKIDLFSGNLDEAEIQWSTGESGTSIFVDEPGNYGITISNDCEEITQEIQVRVDEDIFEKLVYVPNIFSPNGDEINDQFEMLFEDGLDITINEFSIFDRWGNKIFTNEEGKAIWDGKYIGKEIQLGVYVWYIDAVVSTCHVKNKSIFKYGDITLIR